jgi:general stress protein YciG
MPAHVYVSFFRAIDSKNLRAEVNKLSERKNKDEDETSRGKMTVQEAGRKGGSIGGPKVRKLVQEGKEHEQEIE